MSVTLEQQPSSRTDQVFIGHERGTFTHHLTTSMFSSHPIEELDPKRVRTADEIAQALSQGSITDFGADVLSAMQGRTIFDLGCGPVAINGAIRALARVADATSYIGVDIEEVSDEPTKDCGFDEVFVQSDLVDFLSSYTPNDRSFFVVSGIEPEDHPILDENGTWIWPPPYHGDTETRQETFQQVKHYIHSALSEISRISTPGDSLLLGFTAFWHPEDYGFQKIAQTKVLDNKNPYWLTRWEKLVKKYTLYTKLQAA